MNLSPLQKKVLSLGGVSLVSLLIGWQLGQNDITIERLNSQSLPKIQIESKRPADIADVDMTQFWNVWRIASTKYIEKDKVTGQKLIEGATAGLIEALDDPYSVYLTKSQNEDSKEDLNGRFEGVGMQLGFNKDKQLIVVSPITSSPAEKAGIRAGDKIWFIDEKDTIGLSLPEAVEKIRGEKGTKVKLKIQHETSTELTDIEITRDTIIVKSVEVKMIENNTIAHVKINRFGDTTKSEWDEAVRTINSQNIKKVALDVRNNPGGYLDTAEYINSDFINGVVVQQENYLGERRKATSSHAQRLAGVQVVGLINKGSASASEIVAGGLQDTGKAKLVGEQSFGKGTIQEVEDLSGGAGLHITTAKWLLPSGKWIHKEGLKPDIEVKRTEEDILANKDPQLDKAVELLK